MTFERLLVPFLSDDESRTLNRLAEQLHDHQPANQLRDAYYDGKRALRQVGSVIPPHYYRMAMALGWTAKAVDALGRRCNLDTFVWPDGDLDDLGLGEAWEDNYLAAKMSSARTMSLTHGVSFLVNTSGQESVGEPAGLIHVKDALSATGDFNTRTWRLDNLLSVTQRDENDTSRITGFALYLRNLTITARKLDGAWVVDRQAHSWGVPAEAMVYRPSERRPFGYSRISRPLMSLQDMALRTVIRLEGHADVYSFPSLWLLGADESAFTNADGTRKAAWQMLLGGIHALPDDDEAPAGLERAKVEQIAASSPAPHLEQLKWQARAFAAEADIPEDSIGVGDRVNPSSADAIVEARAELLAEAESATDNWTPPTRRAFTRALAMANGLTRVPDDWRTIAPKWRSPLYLSRSQEADAGSKQLAAAPWLAETEVGLELLGLSSQQVTRALADRRRMGGSAALRAITQAAENLDVPPLAPVTDGSDG